MLLLIVANGFFVAGEFALVASDRTKIEQLAARGHRGAQSAVKALKTLSFQLSGAQLGITATSLLVGFVIEPTVGRALAPVVSALGAGEASSLAISTAIALVLATAVQMIVGELFPKNLAIAKPVELGLAVATPLRACNALFKPVILFLNAAANRTVRMLGVEPREELIGVRSLDEVQFLISSSREQGTLREEEFSLLARSISFKDKTAADALIPRVDVIALQKDQTLEEMAALVLETGHSRFPVTGEDLDDVVGVAHVLDMYDAPPEARGSTRVSEIAREPLVVPESASLESVLTRMRRERQQLAVVVDEYGGTAGIVTIEDLLEEIVGDIEDEYDRASRELTSPGRGIHVLSGMLHKDEVLEASGLEMPDGDYETLAGFLLTLFDRIPDQGDHIAYDGWEFKIVEMDDNRISNVLLVAPESRHEASDRAEQ